MLNTIFLYKSGFFNFSILYYFSFLKKLFLSKIIQNYSLILYMFFHFKYLVFKKYNIF